MHSNIKFLANICNEQYVNVKINTLNLDFSDSLLQCRNTSVTVIVSYELD